MSSSPRFIAPLCSRSTPDLRFRAGLVYLDGPTLAPIGEHELEAALEALALGPEQAVNPVQNAALARKSAGEQ